MRDLCSHRGPVSGAPVPTCWRGLTCCSWAVQGDFSRVWALGSHGPKDRGRRGCSAPHGRLASPRGAVGPHVVWLPLEGALQERKPPVSAGLGPEMGTVSLRLRFGQSQNLLRVQGRGHRPCLSVGAVSWFVGIVSCPPAPHDCALTRQPGLSLR